MPPVQIPHHRMSPLPGLTAPPRSDISLYVVFSWLPLLAMKKETRCIKTSVSQPSLPHSPACPGFAGNMGTRTFPSFLAAFPGADLSHTPSSLQDSHGALLGSRGQLWDTTGKRLPVLWFWGQPCPWPGCLALPVSPLPSSPLRRIQALALGHGSVLKRRQAHQGAALWTCGVRPPGSTLT